MLRSRQRSVWLICIGIVWFVGVYVVYQKATAMNTWPPTKVREVPKEQLLGTLDKLERSVASNEATYEDLSKKFIFYIHKKFKSLKGDEEEPQLGEDSNIIPGPNDGGEGAGIRIPVIVFACNRVSVSNCLDNLLKYRPSAHQFPIIVSQVSGSVVNLVLSIELSHEVFIELLFYSGTCVLTSTYGCYWCSAAVIAPLYTDEGSEQTSASVVSVNNPCLPQDCGDSATRDVILSYRDNVTLIEQPDLSEIKVPPKDKKFRGYYKIARHYGWALNSVFARGFEFVIIVEDDLNVAPDFFEYFMGTHKLLRDDPSLW